MTCLIARTARSNPDIVGRTLYLTPLGYWTLHIENARRFTENEALRVKGDASEWRIEQVPQ